MNVKNMTVSGWLIGSVSVSRTVGRAFASWPGHTKDHHKNGTNCLPAWHAMGYCRSLAVQPNCLKCRVVCGTVYGEMHLKDLLGSFVRVGYRIPFLDFYLVLHGLRCRKSTIDLLGSFIRVGYRIPFPDFYLVLHGLRCRKSTIID